MLNITLNRIFKKVHHTLLGKPYFASKDVRIGRHVQFGRNVVFNCKKVIIGDGVIFQDNITVNSDVFEIGDYGTIYKDCFFPGPGEIHIGHNFWLGISSIVDSQGGTYIGNNVGIGPHSQVWTHMIYGDVMYGCRFHSRKQIVIEDDVWLVGHCLVSPVKIGSRSLAMLGSLIIRDMEADHCYAGSPASDITDKIGSQFKLTSITERISYLESRFEEFGLRYDVVPIKNYVKIVTSMEEMVNINKDITIFNVRNRTYTKRSTQLEYRIIRFLLPEAKFIPVCV